MVWFPVKLNRIQCINLQTFAVVNLEQQAWSEGTVGSAEGGKFMNTRKIILLICV